MGRPPHPTQHDSRCPRVSRGRGTDAASPAGIERSGPSWFAGAGSARQGIRRLDGTTSSQDVGCDLQSPDDVGLVVKEVRRESGGSGSGRHDDTRGVQPARQISTSQSRELHGHRATAGIVFLRRQQVSPQPSQPLCEQRRQAPVVIKDPFDADGQDVLDGRAERFSTTADWARFGPS